MNYIPYSRRVNYYETDQMAFMHHSNHIRVFEESRLDLMAQAGLPYDELEKLGIIIPNTEAYASYQTPLKYNDSFTVRPRLTFFNGVKMRFDYTITIDSTGETACTGYTVHCYITPSHNPISLRRKFPDIYEKFMALLEKPGQE